MIQLLTLSSDQDRIRVTTMGGALVEGQDAGVCTPNGGAVLFYASLDGAGEWGGGRGCQRRYRYTWTINP